MWVSEGFYHLLGIVMGLFSSLPIVQIKNMYDIVSVSEVFITNCCTRELFLKEY